MIAVPRECLARARMKKANGPSYRLEIRKSPIQGRGLFALEDIPWGKKIKECRGKIISDKEAKKRFKKGAPRSWSLAKIRTSMVSPTATVRPTQSQPGEPKLLPPTTEGKGLDRCWDRGDQGWLRVLLLSYVGRSSASHQGRVGTPRLRLEPMVERDVASHV